MLREIKRSSFARHVVTLSTGQGASQLITIIATPIIARLFVPEDFGVVALFIAIVTILSVPATFRFELATILPAEDCQALRLVVLTFILIVLASLFVFVVVAGLESIDRLPALIEPMGLWIWLIPIALFFRAAIKVIEGWATRKKQYKAMAISDVGQALTTTGSRIVFGLSAGSSIWGLMAGYIAGLLFKFIMQIRYTKIPFLEIKGDTGKTDLINIGKRYKDFPFYNMPSGMIRAFSQNIPIIMFGIFFGPVVVGLYAMANRLFRMPVNVLSRSIRRVYLQKLSEMKNESTTLRPSYLKITFLLCVFTFVPTLAFWFIGADLCVFLLGEQWLEVGRFVEILTPWLFTTIITSPATAVIIVCRKQKMWLFYNLVVTAVQFSGFVLAYYLWGSAESALIVFVGTGILGNAYVMSYAYWTVSGSGVDYEQG